MELGVSYSLAPPYIMVRRLAGLVAALIRCAVLLAIIVPVSGKVGIPLSIAFYFWCGLLLASLVFALLWPPVDYSRRSYSVSETGIEIRQGVLWRQLISIARSRVQHTDVNQGPIERMYGLSHLVIHTAGTVNASVRLDGLYTAAAMEIRDQLRARETGDAL